MMSFNHAAILSAGVLNVVLGFSNAQAEEPKPPVAPKPPVVPEKSAPEPVTNAELYKLPEKYDSSTLVTFCKKIFEFKPKTEAEGQLHGKSAPTALKNACAKILELEKGEPSDSAKYARRIDLMLRTEGLDPTKPEFEVFVNDFKKFVAMGKVDKEDIGLAMELPGVYEQIKQPQKARELCEYFGKLFEKSEDPEIVRASKALQGTGRRLGLVGNEMVLKGTTIDGKPFDLASLKGKVVLVDFWATWCGFCIQELPLVHKNYAGYRNKGFEVVAVSADEDRGALDKFLAENKSPWINLHDKGGANPAMEFYGIPGFPTTFLIGKDGKVVSLEARGPELGRLLKEQLGEPEAVKDEAAVPEKPTNVEALEKRMKELIEQKEKDAKAPTK